MAYWNNRVVREIECGEPVYVLAEVYYDNDEPFGYRPAVLVAETIEEMQEIADRLLKAVSQPVLEASDMQDVDPVFEQLELDL